MAGLDLSKVWSQIKGGDKGHEPLLLRYCHDSIGRCVADQETFVDGLWTTRWALGIEGTLAMIGDVQTLIDLFILGPQAG